MHGVNARKLKEMGKSILGRFGMRIDNFVAIRDPDTGSYSISFKNRSVTVSFKNIHVH